jgi:Xaa-Pro aminopeptidase
MNGFDRTARLSRLREELEDRGIDCLLLSAGADLPYFTGYEAMPLERLTMLVVPRHEEPTLVVPALEAPRVAPGPFRLRPWTETEDPVGIVAKLAGRPGVAAIGDTTWSVFLLGLLSLLTDTTFVPASTVTRELRMRKDPAEVEALREAGAAVDRVLARLPAEVRFAGRTERQVARDVVDLTIAEGHDVATFWIVASGPNAASPHHEPGERVITEGDAVVVDFGGRRQGYCSDVTRTFVVGEPSAELTRVHHVVAEAQVAAKEAARPGVAAEGVDRAARAVIDAAGYGEFFIHRVGHGIGLEGHEHPYLVAGNRLPLEPGMAFSIEPGIYLPGRLGVRLEDICVVTGSGVEELNRAERSLLSVG